MPEPAFLVDGVMEQKILMKICPGRPVRRLNCNGNNVSIASITKAIDLQINLLGNRYHPIIIIIDREKRELTCDELITDMARHLESLGHADQCVIGVVDRCIENWILADWDTVIEAFGFPPLANQAATEGVQGKSALKQLLPRGIVYNEPTWGKDMFLACRPERIYENSASFKSFIDKLSLTCPWLAKIDARFAPAHERSS
jgi:hypothetical protein